MIEYLALLCDPREGTVVDLILAPKGVSLSAGARLETFVDIGSRPKLRALMDEILREGYAIGWELIFPVHGAPAPFYFAGARHGEHLLLIASIAYKDLSALVDDLTRLNNEQTNRLRDALKELSHRPPPTHDLYNEMSRLNSELATAQRELARRNARLEQLNREKNEFLGMAAHDLRNPMSALIGLSEHLLRDATHSLAPRHVEMLEHLRDSSQHMFALVEDLLSIATLEEGTLRLALASTDLTQLIERCVRIAQEIAAHKGVQIDYDPEGDAQPVVASLDPHKITQALDNLLSNAVKFSRPGGTIEVRLRCDAARATIAVEDHGVGIDEDDLHDLFEPFHAGRPGTQGEKTTGLGLAIVRRIVRGHGGEVEVESSRDVGTTFTVTLPIRTHEPVQTSPGASSGAPETPPAPAPSPALDVLIADDDPLSRLLLQVTLEECGHRIVTAEDARAAIAALATANFDLVIVDLMMPGGGGLAVSDALTHDGARRIPIIAVTGHDGEEMAALAGAAHFDGALSKPPTRPQLEALIAGVLHRCED